MPSTKDEGRRGAKDERVALITAKLGGRSEEDVNCAWQIDHSRVEEPYWEVFLDALRRGHSHVKAEMLVEEARLMRRHGVEEPERGVFSSALKEGKSPAEAAKLAGAARNKRLEKRA